MNHAFRLFAASGLCLSLAGAVIAQPPQRPDDQRDQPRQRDPMRGPEVRDRQVPGVNGSFGEGGGERRKFANENRIPPQVYRQAMEAIMSDDAPDNVRVSDDQRARYEGWMDEFQKSQRAFQNDHRKELAELRKKAALPRPNANGQPQPPQPDDMKNMSEEEAKETIAARERLQSIQQSAPKFEDLYTKIWTDLRPEQQKAVDAKLDVFRAEQAKQREDRYVQQRAKKNKPADASQPQPGAPGGGGGDKPRRPQPPKGDAQPGGPDGQPGPIAEQRRRAAARDGAPGAGPDAGPRPADQPNAFRRGPGEPGSMPDAPDAVRRRNPDGDGAGPRDGGPRIDPQRRDRLMRLFNRLPPDQQEQLLQRLEQRLREMTDDGGQPPAPPRPARPGRGRGGDQGPGEPRPAPNVDDSMMPRPPRGQLD